MFSPLLLVSAASAVAVVSIVGTIKAMDFIEEVSACNLTRCILDETPY